MVTVYYLFLSLCVFRRCFITYRKGLLFKLFHLVQKSCKYIDEKFLPCNPGFCFYESLTVRPAKTQISLRIRPVWSESSLSVWRSTEPFATHWAHSKNFDQTGRMPRLIWVFLNNLLKKMYLDCVNICFWTIVSSKNRLLRIPYNVGAENYYSIDCNDVYFA